MVARFSVERRHRRLDPLQQRFCRATLLLQALQIQTMRTLVTLFISDQFIDGRQRLSQAARCIFCSPYDELFAFWQKHRQRIKKTRGHCLVTIPEGRRAKRG